MKKFLALALMASLILTSCGRDKNNTAGNDTGKESSVLGEMADTAESIVDDILPGNQGSAETDSTLGDEDGNGTVETEPETTEMKDETTDSGTKMPN